MPDLPTYYFVGLALMLVGAFLIGRAIGIHRFVRRRRQLESQVDDLEDFRGRYDAKLDEDPQRVAIEHGKRYVVSRIRRELDDIEQETNPS